MRVMRQTTERVRWVAEAEYARHLARCMLGRAPLRDATLAIGGRRAWSVFDRSDMGPFLSLLGIRSARSRG